jgi:hypothetical protein
LKRRQRPLRSTRVVGPVQQEEPRLSTGVQHVTARDRLAAQA